MYPELEKNDKNPDIKCPICGLGMDIYTECNEDETYIISCLNCKSTFKIEQLIIKKFKVK